MRGEERAPFLNAHMPPIGFPALPVYFPVQTSLDLGSDSSRFKQLRLRHRVCQGRFCLVQWSMKAMSVMALHLQCVCRVLAFIQRQHGKGWLENTGPTPSPSLLRKNPQEHGKI